MNQKLLDNNYIVIPNFIDYYFAKHLSMEFKEYSEHNNLKGDPQAPSSNSEYNYISFLELLCDKNQEVSSILEEKVLPTYAYSRVYHNGSVLEKHKDRDACEISLTVHLDGDKEWPIFIETPTGEEKKVTLKPGDAMMYLGTIANHWRNQYDGEYYAQVFLHYVRSRGECFYTYFDKNENEKSIKSNIEKSTTKEKSIDEKDLNQLEQEHSMEEKSQSVTSSIPKSRTTLEQYIHVFDDIFPENFCKEILKEYENSDDWSSSLVGGNNDGRGVVDKNIRNCDQIFISHQDIVTKNFETRKIIDEKIYSYLRTAIEKYNENHNHFSIDIDTGYQALRYEEGGYYSQHVDSFKEAQRSVSCSIQLNSDYDGGEFAFFDREIIIRTKPGSVIMFPSNFMYPHEIMPVMKGTRYSIITWLV